ncbi:aldehyde dehydrogenase (NADP(+)) [Frondihabitans australicus]|uniref:NADP-dependent aldehyde dehydrogenase n=1 Tax=Frondihabitans australicus TaxID=386892 RepID=A0A495IEF7_9MICO|nr:aldehyde dehydrogenase (NADP(+)) [Frondihabitans australicus]RKR73396.1 NADP-dependent aldehyde dehydrogenase [Frondihabitans australicus]
MTIDTTTAGAPTTGGAGGADDELARVPAILRQAQTAHDEWSALPLERRAELLRAIADGLDEAAGTLIPIAERETGLTTARLTGELTRTTFQVRLFARVVERGEFLGLRVDHADADWPMGAPRPDLRRILVPMGPVLVFAAGNFPFAFSVVGGDTASALAAGSAVVLKAHPGHPELSRATLDVVAASVDAAGGPANLLQGLFSQEAGVAALTAREIKASAFTGSIRGGRALFDIAQSRPEPIPFYGELGSTNPVFVLPEAAGARADSIAEGFLASVTGSQGQLCTKPGVLFVPTGSPVLAAVAGASSTGPARLLDPRIEANYLNRLESLRERADVSVLWDDDASLATPPSPSVLRTTIDAVLADPETLVAETFGPTSLVVEYTDVADLTRVARGLEGQLTSTVVGDEGDTAAAGPLVQELTQHAGRVLWNMWPTGVSVTYAQTHGGPYPATTAPGSTSVGTTAIERFLRPVTYQNLPDALLPEALRRGNPLGLPRTVDGVREA